MRRFFLILPLACACGGPHAHTQPDPSVGKQSAVPALRDEETALMDRLRESVVSAPQTTVDLADEAETRFPDSPLREEREALAIDALINLQKIGSARSRADLFLRRYPDSRYAAHIANMTGVHVTPQGPPSR